MATFLGMLDCRRPNDMTPTNGELTQPNRVDHRYAMHLQQRIEASQRSNTPNKVNKLQLASSRRMEEQSRSISPFQQVSISNHNVIPSNQVSYHRPPSPFKKSLESNGWQQQNSELKEASFNMGILEAKRNSTVLSSLKRNSGTKETHLTVNFDHSEQQSVYSFGFSEG